MWMPARNSDWSHTDSPGWMNCGSVVAAGVMVRIVTSPT